MNMEKPMNNSHYNRLFLMIILSFISMYVLMYAMVNIFANVFANYNQFYMAGLMTAPMIIIEMFLMSVMYHNKKWNIMIIAASFLLLMGFWTLIRQQVAISDKQFLKSMIPHHAGAILMCQNASIHDQEIINLCDKIISGQQVEIDWMRTKLELIGN